MCCIALVFQRQRLARLGDALLQLLIQQKPVRQVNVQLRVGRSRFRGHPKIRNALRSLVQLQPQQSARTE